MLQGGWVVTGVDVERLRQLAQVANRFNPEMTNDEALAAVNAYIDALHPSVVLALLDRLDRQEQFMKLRTLDGERTEWEVFNDER